MSTRFKRCSTSAVVAGCFILLASGCAVTGEGGYGNSGDVTVSFRRDYYDPFGFDYGPWGPDYQVGPYRGGAQRPQRSAGNAPGRNYRPAPASHSVPSIPSRPRPRGARPSGTTH